MNETIRNLMERRSVRAYTEKQVPEEVLNEILEAGRFAPSGMNRQPALFIAVQDKETRDTLSRMNAAVMGNSGDPFYGAPTVVLVLVEASVGTGVEDGALAMGNMLNAAYSLGLGSCWIHRAKEMFESEEGKALLRKWGVQGEYRGVGCCILGYPADGFPAAKPRREGNVLYIR